MEVTTGTGHSEEPLFDWKVDIERLEREARSAVQSKEPNDWALVEAECSQDLIAAELKAVQMRKNADEATARTVEHLKAWGMKVERVIRQLRALTA